MTEKSEVLENQKWLNFYIIHYVDPKTLGWENYCMSAIA